MYPTFTGACDHMLTRAREMSPYSSRATMTSGPVASGGPTTALPIREEKYVALLPRVPLVVLMLMLR